MRLLPSYAIDDPCSMCERRPATTTYGFPVCQPCHDWLHKLNGELERMEATDPDLKALGDEIDQRWNDR